MPDVHVDGVRYAYPDSREDVLTRIDARFSTGSPWAIQGTNGAGKTTLLELCAGLRKPASGRVMLGDRPIHATDASYLPSENPVYPELTVKEHETICATLWNLSGPDRTTFGARFTELAARLGIADRDDRVEFFSRGMREKLALTMTIARPADVVLLDEPFASLDSHSLELCQELIRTEAASRIMIITSHIPAVLAPLEPHYLHLVEGAFA